MSPRRPLLASCAAVLVLAIAATLAGGCSAVSGLDGLTFDKDAGPCSRDADCNTEDPCKVGRCSDGGCSTHDLADDPSFDDHDPCTLDTCVGGMPRHDPAADGAKCTAHGNDGTCRSGECNVSCKADADCASNDRCAIGSCATGSCRFELLDGVPVPGVMQVVGDCSLRLCNNGEDTHVPDPTDLPSAGPCETAKCSPDGQPIKDPKPARAVCSSGGSFCDGHGDCVDCLADSDCPGDGTLCNVPSCTAAHACGVTPRAAGTALPPAQQVPGDCHQLVCDGNGGQMASVDPTDVQDDGNPCTNDSCDNGGNPTHTNVANGTSCGNGLSCVSGACNGCTTPAQCPPHPNEQCNSGSCVCTPDTCASLGLKCGTVTDNGCGTSMNCNDGQKDNGETDVDCGGPNCSRTCAQGKRCNGNSDCTSGHCVDGYCCESSCTPGCLACSAALTGSSNGLCRAVTLGTDPHGTCSTDPASSCGHTGGCDGSGNCQYYDSSVVCSATCQGDSLTYDVCVAPNTCSFSGSLPCTPYTCRTGNCLSSCVSSMDCAANHICSGNVCN